MYCWLLILIIIGVRFHLICSRWPQGTTQTKPLSEQLQCGAVITRSIFSTISTRHTISRPLGRGMGCLSWIQLLIDILPQFLQLLMQYPTILDRVITALNCTRLLLTLYVLFFFQSWQNHRFTFYVIPPHWHNSGFWNPSSSKTGSELGQHRFR